MIAQFIKKNPKCLVPAVLLITFVGTFIAHRVFAQATSGSGGGLTTVDPAFLIVTNARSRIDPVAIVTDNGRHLFLTGPLACTGGERAYLRLTVTQRSTGAVAEGSTFLTCTGGQQQWEARASTVGKETFAEGAATGVLLGLTTDRGTTTDAHQWLVDLTLVKQ
jgi:hypothetical protein